MGQTGEAFIVFVPSYLSRSRHGVYYFRWPLVVALHPQHRSSTLKLSLRTRDPREALRLSLILSNVGRELVRYGAAYGMKFGEIRQLLSTHFSQLLAAQKLQISTNGRLDQLQTAALENGLAFAREAAEEGGPLLPSGNDSDLTIRRLERNGVSLQPGSTAFINVSTELKRAYRDYCALVLDYDRSLDSYQFGNQTDTTVGVQSFALVGPSPTIKYGSFYESCCITRDDLCDWTTRNGDR